MNTSEKLKHHFSSKPVVWVAMWGLSKLRKRGGGFAGALDGKAKYYDKWYARAMSEDTAKKLADLGVNLAILPFSVGGGADIEKEERYDFERTTSYMHKHGIVSLPYFQWQNILQEASKLPDMKWAVRLDGSRQGFAYWRRTACQSSKGFLDYMRGLTTDAMNRGADGIWIDNTYLHPCRCKLCETNFSKYLTENRKDLLDLLYLKDFDSVEIPPAIHPRILDPVMQAYIEFNCHRCESTLQEVKDHLEGITPNALFASNPALHRGANHYEKGVDLYRQGKLHDILYLENKLCPVVKDNFISGNFHGFISFSELDCATVAGSWKAEVDFDSTVESSSSGMPETKDEVESPVFEGPTYNNFAGMFWTVRSRYHGICEKPEDLMDMYFEKEDIYGWMKDSVSAISKTEQPKAAKNIANIAIYHSKPSLSFSHPTAFPSLCCAEEMLLRNLLPYNILYSEEAERIKEYELVVIPKASFMSDNEAKIITDYVKDGGNILVIGDSSLFDEYGFIREDFALKDATGVGYFDRIKSLTVNKVGKGNAAYIPSGKNTSRLIPNLREENHIPGWYEKESEIIAAINNILGDNKPLSVEAKGNIGVSLSKDNSGKTIVKLMSYDTGAAVQTITILLNSKFINSTNALWQNSEGEKDFVKAPESSEPYTTFKIKNFRRFGTLVIE